MKKLIITLMTLVIGTGMYAQKSVQYKTVEQKLNEEYCSGMFQSSEGTILDLTSNPGANSYLNILNWIEGRVSGLQVYTSRTGVTIPVMRGQIPGIFVDEQQVSASYLTHLPIQDIAFVKIIKTPFYGGFNSGGGAIAIYTINEEEETDETGGN